MTQAGPVTDATRVSFHEALGERIGVVEPADGVASAQVVCVHGLSDHLGRQLHLLRWLARQGYRAVGFELLGHGGRESAWSESAWVYEAYEASEDPAVTRSLLEDGLQRAARPARGVSLRQYEALRRAQASDHLAQIDRVLEFTSSLDPALPIVLVGHSMGALLCIETAWRWRLAGVVRGAVLLSPALRPQGRPGNVLEGLLIDAVWGLRRASFSLARSSFKTALDLNLPVDTAWGNRWISDLPEEVALFTADPLVPEQLPTRYLSSIEAQMAATEKRGSRFPVPALMLLPDSDGITSVGAGLAFARSVRAAVGRERFQLEQFAGLCAHDLLRSSAREAVQARLAGWLETLLGARGRDAESRPLPLTA